MRLSIRVRLTLWNTLALALALLGLSALVYALLAHALYAQLDRALLAEHEQLRQDRRLADDPAGRLRHWVDEFLEHEKSFCVVYDSDGRVFLRTEELAEDSVPPAPPLAPGEVRYADRALPVIGRQRLLQAPLEAGGHTFTVLHLAPLTQVDHELRELRLVLATAVPVALALSGGLAYALARKALAPVEQLHRLTSQITADRLDRRLPVSGHDELAQLAGTINAMIARLERSFDEVRRFTADASHELRTPLTAIRTEVEVALARPLTVPDCQALLGSVLEECERLARLSEQLLALAREDAGTSPRAAQRLALAEVVGAVTETMRPLAETRALELRLRAEAVEVCGDAGRLRQVFYNLLDNALKYTPPGGVVEVRVGRDDRGAVVAVRDTGVGIAAEHLPHVFERFYRADGGRGREQGGNGLGLSIARSIAVAHGGDIELSSALGRGTTATVVLPPASQSEMADRR
jgi:heavy metal sensor kinase